MCHLAELLFPTGKTRAELVRAANKSAQLADKQAQARVVCKQQPARLAVEDRQELAELAPEELAQGKVAGNGHLHRHQYCHSGCFAHL